MLGRSNFAETTMAVTQKQIAEKLNISSSLVARALKGHTEVALSTRQRVEAMAKEMGYSADTNREARTLAAMRYGRSIRKGIIAVGLLPIEYGAPRYVPYYIPFLNAVEEEAARRGFDVYLCPSRRDEIPRIIRERGVDGVISMGYVPSQLREIQSLDIPILTLHEEREGAHSALANEYQGTRQLTEHLVSLGHRHIAFVGAPGLIGSGPRLNAFLEVLSEYGLHTPPEWIIADIWMSTPTADAYCRGCGNRCSACTGWQTLLERSGGRDAEGKLPFTAVICHNDATAMGVIDHAQQDGVDIPGELSITGFDDVSLHYRFQPAITTAGFSRYEMGVQSIRLLEETIIQIEKGESPSYHHYLAPTSLVVRESTTPPVECRQLIV
jgi:LacI family transcriptional regulator